jgi:hypothetical protein
MHLLSDYSKHESLYCWHVTGNDMASPTAAAGEVFVWNEILSDRYTICRRFNEMRGMCLSVLPRDRELYQCGIRI